MNLFCILGNLISRTHLMLQWHDYSFSFFKLHAAASRVKKAELTQVCSPRGNCELCGVMLLLGSSLFKRDGHVLSRPAPGRSTLVLLGEPVSHLKTAGNVCLYCRLIQSHEYLLLPPHCKQLY